MRTRILSYVLLGIFGHFNLNSMEPPIEFMPPLNFSPQNNVLGEYQPHPQFQLKRRFSKVFTGMINANKALSTAIMGKSQALSDLSHSSSEHLMPANVSSDNSAGINRQLQLISEIQDDLSALAAQIEKSRNNSERVDEIESQIYDILGRYMHQETQQSCAERLTNLIMAQNENDPLTIIETKLRDILQNNPELETIIKRRADIREALADQNDFDIEKYTKPRTILNLFNIGSGICLDAGQILTTYVASRWIEGGVIGIAAIDGLITGINLYLDKKIQEVIDYYGHDLQGQQKITIGLSSKQMVQDVVGEMSGLYSDLLAYINDNNGLSYVKTHSSFIQLSNSIARLKSVDTFGNVIKLGSKILAELGSAAVGITGLVCGAGSMTTLITATCSLALSAIAERVSTINSNSNLATQLLLLANGYIEFWDVIDIIDAITQQTNTEEEDDIPNAY